MAQLQEHPSVVAVEIALGESERFPRGTRQFEIFAPQMATLISTIGEELMNTPVGMSNLCDVTARFVGHLAEDRGFLDSLPEDEAELVSTLYKGLAGQLEEIAQTTDQFLADNGLTEAEAMELDSLGLNDEAKELYQDGQLTFAALIMTCPDVFIPRT